MATSKTSWELVDYIHPSLSSVDYTRPMVKVVMVVSAILASIVIYLLTHIFFSLTSDFYPRLPLKQKVFWNLSLVRAVYGILCIVVGSWAFLADTVLEQDVVRATSPTAYLAMGITVGFFLFECVALTWSDVCFNTFSGLLHLHHWISLFGYGVVLVTDASHNLGCKGMILEMSTPFSALCWTLLKAGKERTFLWKANQFLLVHTFHLRNVAEMAVWYITFHHWDNIRTNMPLLLFVPLYLQLVIVTCFLTPYWTLRKTRQMICPIDWNFENTTATVDHGNFNGNGIHGNRNGHTRLDGSAMKED